MRSALEGSPAPGPQEIIGVYVPFPGTGLSIKAGLAWDGVTRGPVVIGGGAPFSAQAAGCAPTGRWVQKSTMVWEPQAAPQARSLCAPPPPPAPLAAPSCGN